MEFDQFAGDYEKTLDRSVNVSGEDSVYFADYKARYLRRMLSAGYSGKVLDFGCGVGILSTALKRHLPAVQIDGFDVSEESIRNVPEQLAGKGRFTSNYSELSDDYNVAVVANVMHHVPLDERNDVVHGLASRLKSGGILIIFEHNPSNPVTRWVVEHCPFDTDAVLLPPDETRSYLSAANFRSIRHDYIVFMPRFLSFLRPLEPWLGWCPAGAQYAMVAQKDG